MKQTAAIKKLSTKIKLTVEKLKGMREELKELKTKNKTETMTLVKSKKPAKKQSVKKKK